ncbi:MAG: DUF4150 domain-containing protein [Desulfovibrio sp.]|jgi:hypothetical protein|nr:DUF4150 domain-containing protein [Desulfovibrio sp.]MBI4959100.1 DUF4150 domain-containing protein [Desulfovibrio sp.]
MFALTLGSGVDFAFPDVCITPVGPIPTPIPYPNISESITTQPAADNITIDCMPVINLMSMGLVSEGDEPGVLLGAVSHMESGQTDYTLGCFTIFMDAAPCQRLTSLTRQNCLVELPNAVGMTIAPSQVTVLTLG